MIEIVKAMLDEYGWKYELESEDHIITGFKSSLVNRAFTIHIIWSQDWITLVSSLLTEPISQDLDAKLSMFIARSNYYMPVVKYSITAENELVLSAELPTNNLTAECLMTGLDMLCAYIEEQSEVLSQVIENN
jgi:hypothetical protein